MIITLYWNGMLCFKRRFSLFDSLKYYQILKKHWFLIGYSDTLHKLATFIYPLCFWKQTLELLLHLSFKVELTSNGLQDIFFGFKIYPGVEKLLQDHQAFLSYLGLNVSRRGKTVARPPGFP